jgi:hypothetical protein
MKANKINIVIQYIGLFLIIIFFHTNIGNPNPVNVQESNIPDSVPGIEVNALGRAQFSYPLQVGMAMAAVGMVLLRTAAFVNALGVVGGGLGFVAGGISTGTMEGALAGAEEGFLAGTVVNVVVGSIIGGFGMYNAGQTLVTSAGASTLNEATLTRGIGTAMMISGGAIMGAGMGAIYGAIIGYISGGLSGYQKNDQWDEKEARRRGSSYASIGARTGFYVGAFAGGVTAMQAGSAVGFNDVSWSSALGKLFFEPIVTDFILPTAAIKKDVYRERDAVNGHRSPTDYVYLFFRRHIIITE